MKEDFVTYKQSVKLKELGFDWKTFAFYLGTVLNTKVPSWQITNTTDVPIIPAPTLAQAQKWLREKEIEVAVFAEFDGELRTGQWVWLMRKFNTHLFDTVFSEDEDLNYDTYEQALSAGIDKALELLNQKQ